jgi:hypothetical protein
MRPDHRVRDFLGNDARKFRLRHALTTKETIS